MLTQQQAEELYLFFDKYVSAMHSIALDEKEKLNALLSNSLPRIEHAISTAQANAKQIENLESKRAALQASVGCADMTLSQLTKEIPDSRRSSMTSLFSQLNRYVDEIKFNNDKSVEIAKANIVRINPDSPALQNQGEPAYSASTPYDSAVGVKQTNRPIFKTTV